MSGDKIILYVIGDSTASIYAESLYPRMGWAQVFQEFLDKNKITVCDRAISGRSSKSFYDEGAWNPIFDSLKKGDYVFIQFGHNDSKKEDPSRYTEPFTAYKHYLKIYVEGAIKKQATPVLLTPIHRNIWGEDKKLVNSHLDYPDAMKELAGELKVHLIDITRMTKELFETLGEKKTSEFFLILEKGRYPNYPEGIIDVTHLQENGATRICKLIAQGIRELKLEISEYLI
jgi:lysophospholipase L1-like esterase